MKRTTLDKIRESLRLQQVYNTMLRYGWEMLIFDRWEILRDFHYRMQAWVWDLPKDLADLPMPVKVRLMLEELGPTYVKMGQIVSSQASVIPADWASELELLQSSVQPFETEQVRQIIRTELGAFPEALYASFEETPFAAASTAQVHRATLHNGTAVVVKVQRPDIYNQMKADIGIMQNAVRVVSARSDYARSVDMVGMVEQFGTSVLAELNYHGEAYNSFRLAENLKDLPGVHVPRVFPELSTSRVLTMEFIRGVKISNLEAIDRSGIDRQVLARNTLRAIVKQLLIDGFFHADPHPGNVLVDLQSGDVAFIDTGMVGELELQHRLNLVQLLYAVQQSDIPGMGQIMRNLSEPFIDNFDAAAYQRDFERRVGNVLYSAGTASFGQSVNMSFDLLREHGLRLNPNLTMAIKALTQAEAITTLLYPEGGITTVGVELIQELFLKVVTADRVIEEGKKQVMTVARELVNRMPSLSDATLKWLDQYQRGRLEVYLDTSGLATEVGRLGGYSRQIVIAIMLVGMIVGSAIATSAIPGIAAVLEVGEPWKQIWGFFFQLAYLGYVLSMGLAFLLILRLLWRWVRGDR
jgi:ubiquinone biosynthesis protein